MNQHDKLDIGVPGVAQIFNLLYRRFAIGKRMKAWRHPQFVTPADFKSAIQQIENLRYVVSRRAFTTCTKT
jgi:hypothetical protein